MKSSLALLVIFSIVLGAYVVDARRDPENYWKAIMKDEVMPKALSDLLIQDPSSQATGEGRLSSFREADMGRFTRNFNAEPNVILYHSKEDNSKKSTEQAIIEN
ncbi:hypothetical protein Leryth_004353 [Lithospermum erythrorhizon]|uniref:Uncharacterized protein n=1 Tax=Lithospermum erythrorhizon TaxID=34254 RepID=A0AAV3P0I6_LITER|nr:hypothetical protein Leryth_004353 [Lithospermum erythrorhizon]